MNEKSKDVVRIGDFEKDLKRLEEIVKELENGELTLEESLKKFEEGIRLARRCEKTLAEAERRIEILLQNEEGEIEAHPFDITSIENDSNHYTASEKNKSRLKKTSKQSIDENIDLTDESNFSDEDLPF